MLLLALAVASVSLLALSVAAPTPSGSHACNEQSSLTFVFQNNLNASDDQNHVGAILLDPMLSVDAEEACNTISETLLSQATIQNYSTDFAGSLSYLSYKYGIGPTFLISSGQVTLLEPDQLSFSASTGRQQSLPVLCTQSSNESQPPNSTASLSNEVSVAAAGNTYVGFRNQKSFRFLGIRYAEPAQRFMYSQPYTSTGESVNATAYGSQCVQVGGGSEDCLFLNIQTPYIPKASSTQNLRPVLFWIHGGGFTGGTGADPLSDGGNLASRENIVTVTINYRLSTLGFLAIPGTDIKGNFGIGDQINALKWTVDNVAKFGGDPSRITIMGESAGAVSVRTLLGSPPAVGLFQGAVAMSNLGGGVDLGLDSNYGTTYSNYYTINESYTVAGTQVFNETNCTASSLADEIKCLSAVNATDLVSVQTVARYVVQDGTIVNTPQLDVTMNNGSSAYVPIMFGTAANDGSSFSIYSPTPLADGNLTGGLQVGLGINQSYAQAIIDSDLFPFYSTGNFTLDAFNVTQRVAEDNTFRCIDQATVYAGAITGTFPATYFYQFERTINGYNPEDVDSNGPIEPGYPNGDPYLPYFRLHGADMPWAFGNFYTPLRDANDLYSSQLVSSYFAWFVKTGTPNQDIKELRIRGPAYQKTLAAVEETGPWDKVTNEDGPLKFLDYPARTGDFQDKPQCAWLNYSLSFYLQ